MKKDKGLIVFMVLGTIYLVLTTFTPIKIKCLFHEITGLYCPGCGVTRMVLSIFKGDMKEAFCYNQLLFISFPAIIFYTVDYIISFIKNRKPLYKNISNTVWIVYIVLLIIFMIIRNIFPYFAPPTI